MMFLLLLSFFRRFPFLDWNERLSSVLVVGLQNDGVDKVGVVCIGLAISGVVAVSRGVVQNLLHPVGVLLRRVDALEDETIPVESHLETIFFYFLRVRRTFCLGRRFPRLLRLHFFLQSRLPYQLSL